MKSGETDRISTQLVCPPIPIRCFDWAAWFGDYEPDSCVGFGETEALAIKDLRDQVEEFV